MKSHWIYPRLWTTPGALVVPPVGQLLPWQEAVTMTSIGVLHGSMQKMWQMYHVWRIQTHRETCICSGSFLHLFDRWCVIHVIHISGRLCWIHYFARDIVSLFAIVRCRNIIYIYIYIRTKSSLLLAMWTLEHVLSTTSWSFCISLVCLFRLLLHAFTGSFHENFSDIPTTSVDWWEWRQQCMSMQVWGGHNRTLDGSCTICFQGSRWISWDMASFRSFVFCVFHLVDRSFCITCSRLQLKDAGSLGMCKISRAPHFCIHLG